MSSRSQLHMHPHIPSYSNGLRLDMYHIYYSLVGHPRVVLFISWQFPLLFVDMYSFVVFV